LSIASWEALRWLQKRWVHCALCAFLWSFFREIWRIVCFVQTVWLLCEIALWSSEVSAIVWSVWCRSGVEVCWNLFVNLWPQRTINCGF
jgi:hypothetical protein